MVDPSSVRSIQVYHLNHIGDMIFSLPLLASLRHAFPRARILSTMRPAGLDIWKMAGLADEYLIRQRGWGVRMRAQLVHALRRRKPDLSVLLSQSIESVLLARLSGSPVRVGFRTSAGAGLLTHRAEAIGPPNTSSNLRLLEAVGVAPTKTDYVGLLRAPAGEFRRMNNRLTGLGAPGYKKLVVLSPGASPKRSVKEWTDEGFAAVIDHFGAQTDTAVAITGTEPATEIVARTNQPVLDLTCHTTLPELVALMERADLTIGVDSGALHVAAAVGTPVVGLYGPSDPDVTGPQGQGHKIVRLRVECSPCFRNTCPIGRICMEDMTAGMVIDAAESALAQRELVEPYTEEPLA